MKKIFAIVLAGIMMLSLAACGGTGSSTPAAASSEPAGASAKRGQFLICGDVHLRPKLEITRTRHG